ncbi:hypothetical protein [Arthrobacter sp. B0490]|uniref:hypothetical protein n=1 Tax=Arthrobacter sp. B0490 TaxID=2058891 RepID=UPI000CE41EFD|nr:hypothetical protein [Arthrobacter sp. B0490]
MSSMTPLEKATQRSRHLLLLVAIALVGGLGGCEYAPDDASLPSASTPTTEAGTVPPQPDGGDSSTVPPLPDSGELEAGTYLVSSFTKPFEITVPGGWLSDGGEVLFKDDPDHPDELAVAVVFWPTPYVPTDACAWQGNLVEVGPSAEAFVDAMTAQTSTASTTPVEVMVGDYSGFEFDHSVEGDLDITPCDRDKFCISSEFSNECTSWYSTNEERQTFRVVDLDGQRAVIWVVQFHESTSPELTREARAVFDSIVFTSDK